MPTWSVILVAVALLSYALTCWALIDVAWRSFTSLGEKAAWAMVAFIPFIGWLIYLMFGLGRGSRRKPPEPDSL